MGLCSVCARASGLAKVSLVEFWVLSLVGGHERGHREFVSWSCKWKVGLADRFSCFDGQAYRLVKALEPALGRESKPHEGCRELGVGGLEVVVFQFQQDCVELIPRCAGVHPNGLQMREN